MSLINSEIIQQYNDDGATVIRDCVSDHWLGLLSDAIEHDISDPGPFVHAYQSESGGGRFHGNLRLWETEKRFRDFCFNSPLPEMAAEILQCPLDRLVYDNRALSGLKKGFRLLFMCLHFACQITRFAGPPISGERARHLALIFVFVFFV